MVLQELILQTLPLPAAANRIIGSSFCDAVRTRVPGPLPLMGAFAAFGWSRRLRRRLAKRCLVQDSPAGLPVRSAID